MSSVSGVPWQAAITGAMVVSIAFLFAMTIGGIAAWLGLAVVVVLCQCFALLVMLQLIPLMLNLSRTFYGYLLIVYFVFVAGAIAQYALAFYRSGLLSAAGGVTKSFRDAVYFSVTTWTTLGYGDLTAPPHMRLVTSAEALMGAVSLAIGVSFFWLYVTEQLVPKDRALFDGKKLHSRSLTWHHTRVYALGKFALRTFDDSYIDPPPGGTKFRYDPTKGRWEPMASDEPSPEDDETLQFK
jgi:hypothetical protein